MNTLCNIDGCYSVKNTAQPCNGSPFDNGWESSLFHPIRSNPPVKKVIMTQPYSGVSGDCSTVLRLKQQLQEDAGFDAALQCTAQFTHGDAQQTLLHLPALQRLVHFLCQAITVIVMLDGIHIYVGQPQFTSHLLPVATDVLTHKLQVTFSDGVVLCSWQHSQIEAFIRCGKVGPFEICFICFPKSVFSVLIFLDCFWWFNSILIIKNNV